MTVARAALASASSACRFCESPHDVAWDVAASGWVGLHRDDAARRGRQVLCKQLALIDAAMALPCMTQEGQSMGCRPRWWLPGTDSSPPGWTVMSHQCLAALT